MYVHSKNGLYTECWHHVCCPMADIHALCHVVSDPPVKTSDIGILNEHFRPTHMIDPTNMDLCHMIAQYEL